MQAGGKLLGRENRRLGRGYETCRQAWIVNGVTVTRKRPESRLPARRPISLPSPAGHPDQRPC